jgi:hypothetical protein
MRCGRSDLFAPSHWPDSTADYLIAQRLGCGILEACHISTVIALYNYLEGQIKLLGGNFIEDTVVSTGTDMEIDIELYLCCFTQTV